MTSGAIHLGVPTGFWLLPVPVSLLHPDSDVGFCGDGMPRVMDLKKDEGEIGPGVVGVCGFGGASGSPSESEECVGGGKWGE
jgi:hypothetical protein